MHNYTTSSTEAAGERGFSLFGLMMALAITMIIGLSTFEMFAQNEAAFRDQNQVLELHQSVRAVASMLADELRMAGQGVPAHAASFEATPQEGAQTFLNGSNAGLIRFRSSIRSGKGIVDESMPLSFTVGTSTDIDVEDVTDIAAVIGADTTRFVYIWGRYLPTSLWTWIRARVTAVDVGGDRLTITPTQISTRGGVIDWEPYLVVEEAVAYRLNGSDIERGTSSDFTALLTPAINWEVVGENFTGLTFTYYDEANNVVTPTTLADRAVIRRVDFTLEAETDEPLESTGVEGAYAVTMSIYPRNVALY